MSPQGWADQGDRVELNHHFVEKHALEVQTSSKYAGALVQDDPPHCFTPIVVTDLLDRAVANTFNGDGETKHFEMTIRSDGPAKGVLTMP